MLSVAQYDSPIARKWYAFYDALESVVAGTAQSPSEAERAMWSAFGAYRHCYLEYSASLLSPHLALTEEPKMSAPVQKYYEYRRKLHAFLVGTGDDDTSLLEARMAKEHHECAYREHLVEQGRSTCGWLRALSIQLQCPRMRTLRLISEYPDTHQLAAACERINGVVEVPSGIRDLLRMDTMCGEDVRLIEDEFTVLYESIIEKKGEDEHLKATVARTDTQIVPRIMAAPRPSATQPMPMRRSRSYDVDTTDSRYPRARHRGHKQSWSREGSSRSRPRTCHRRLGPISRRCDTELAQRPRVRSRSRRRDSDRR